ncbi:MAG TPA: Rieske (2Fe-2S) protein [Stellaceae bacterium]|jgi:3-phenylpropionate/trans-cinnamate dioxygenase ferredoxin subunit|nr:Rieske (2Fe-2S) protein [Stellaceae bacterium]
MSEHHVVGTTDEIPPGTHKLFTIRGREIGVFNVKGDYYALLNRCPHAGASLCRGRVGGLVVSDGPGDYEILREGEILRCPWHGWEYDIRTGQSWCDPEKVNTRQYKVTVEPGARVAKGPYIAETFPVHVDANYIVVEV